MKERPILFSAPMVQAILDGRKTQTRRVMKPQPSFEHPFWRWGGAGWPEGHNPMLVPSHSMHSGCPYGKPGDRLWVRETWASDKQVDHIKPKDLSKGEPIYYAASDGWISTGCLPIERGKLRPSIFMMQWMSRILLEIIGVRVERLQSINRGDAMAEGCPFPNMAAGPDPRHWYAELWGDINGPESWATNPWVWVVEFKRIEGAS